ncbi:OsmC family protein [Chryseobacterium sp.]|uniref:OsmC family protein n=1 Tax=Chryseobacterium sp. TaxID=1871047 RepID=UPI0035B4D8B8
MKTHHYKTTIQWTGNKGSGTSSYRDYERSHTISAENKPVIEGSSDPAFRGDRTKYNPEEMLLSSLSSCHMLWYLHFCSEAGIIVTEYTDEASGIMAETASGSGHFTEVILHPRVTVAEASMVEKAEQLHHKANEYCFIANSVNFPVKHIPAVLVKSEK